MAAGLKARGGESKVAEIRSFVMARVYSPSGKLGNGLLLMPVAGALSATVLGVVYGYINNYNPLIYIQFFATLFYGAGVGYVLKKAIEWSKCRSVDATFLIGGTTGLFALYAAWAGFEYVLLNRSLSTGVTGPTLFQLFSSPRAVWNIAWGINETGWFTLFHSNTQLSGIILTLFWIVEAAIIVGITVIIPLGFVRGHVFCEDCSVWCKEKKDLARFGFARSPEVKQRLVDGDLTALVELPTEEVLLNQPYIRVDSQSCEQCKGTAAFSATEITPEKDKEGKWEEKEKELAGPMLYTDDDMVKLAEILSNRTKHAPQAAIEKIA